MKISIDKIKLSIENFLNLLLQKNEEGDKRNLKIEVDTPKVKGETEIEID